MDLSIIIVSYKSHDDIVNALDSVQAHFAGMEYEVIVVNNFAGDDSIGRLPARYGFVTVVDDGVNYGFGRANNAGMKAARGKYICYLNPDVIVLDNILPLMQKLEADRSIGLIAPKLYNPDCSVQLSCYQLPSPYNWFAYNMMLNKLFPKVSWWGNYPLFTFSYEGDAEIEWLSGAYMLLRREVAEQAGGFDPDFFMYCEDTEICWKVRQLGYKVVFSDAASAIHIGGTSSAPKSESQAKMMAISYIILWKKHYPAKVVKKMARLTRAGSRLHAMYWKLFGMWRGATKNDYVFYSAMAREIMHSLREAGEYI